MKPKHFIILGAVLALLLWGLPKFVEIGKTYYLTWEHGDELGKAILTFENTTDAVSGSRDKYYGEERQKFGLVSTNEALRSRLVYWDSFWESTYEQQKNLYLTSNLQLTDISVVEFGSGQAKVKARLRWHMARIDRASSIVQEESEQAADMTYLLVFEDDTWKVSNFEAATRPSN